uniref:CSON002760 protein n=1 Tax=Culicoides sonorensis TaxID=179676 RepID=A0A336MJU6_CULSO
MPFDTPKKWDSFFGPDPLAGRVNTLEGIPYKRGIFMGPISNQNYMHSFEEVQALAAKLSKQDLHENNNLRSDEVLNGSPVKLSKKRSMDFEELGNEPKTTFAAVVASNSTGKLQQYCTFCKGNREDHAVYSSHTTNNCLILQNYVCRICGLKGHTLSHCKMNAIGGSVVTTMRRADEISRFYDINFPKQ